MKYMELWKEKKKKQKKQKKQEDEGLMLVEADSHQEERLKSKHLYKLLLIVIKYTPIVILIVEILFSILAYYGIDTTWLSYIGSVSLVNLMYLYIASYVFRFCYLYRLSLHSIVITNLLALYDTLFHIPLTDLNMLRVYLVMLLIDVIAFIKFKMQDAEYNKKSIA